MASSENLAAILDPWPFRPSFQDPWISDAFSRETQTLTKALHRSFLASDSDALSSFIDSISPDSVSGVSASDPDTAPPPPKRHRPSIPPTAAKLSKRKSRASKRNHTTFITADPANFRQMVQQVTGVRFGNSHLQIPPVLKPEPHRPAARFPGLPTLDTSAPLLNHHTTTTGSEITGSGPISFGPGLGHAPIGSDFDTFSSFPTLESWKAVM